MKRSANEPSTSTGKRARPTHFTLQQVMEALDDSEGDEAILLHQYEYSSSSDVDIDRDLDSDRSSDDDDDRSRARPTVREGGVSIKQIFVVTMFQMMAGLQPLWLQQ